MPKLTKKKQKQFQELKAEGNYSEAYQLLTPIAEQGNRDAQYELGELLKTEIIEKRDLTNIDQMVYWLQKAVDQNHIKAMISLADLYSHYRLHYDSYMYEEPSPFFKREPLKAIELYTRAAEHEPLDFLMGFDSLLMQREENKVTKAALKVFIRFAERGNHHAQMLLMLRYFHPMFQFTISENELLTSKWFNKALQMENKEAVEHLCDIAQSGNKDAFSALLAVAQHGNATAAYNIGEIYYDTRDFSQSLLWLQKAADAHQYGALLMLSNIFEKGDCVPQSDSDAFRLLKQAIEERNIDIPQHCLKIGKMYEEGRGTPQDYQQAMEYYHRIIDHDYYFEEEIKDCVNEAQQSFRKLKKIIYPDGDNILFTIQPIMNLPCSFCSFAIKLNANSQITVKWGDDQINIFDCKEDEWITLSHDYNTVTSTPCNIRIESDEIHIITAFRIQSTVFVLQSLDVTRCPVLINLICTDMKLRVLDLSQNTLLEGLIIRNNKLKKLDIRENNYLTSLDCSNNPLSTIRWNFRSALTRLCMVHTALSNDTIEKLQRLVTLNKGEEVGCMDETSLNTIQMRMEYYIRTCTWKELKEWIKQNQGRRPSWEECKQALYELRSRKSFTPNKNVYVLVGGDYFPYCIDETKDIPCGEIMLQPIPWNESLDFPVVVEERKSQKEWMMFPRTTHIEISGQCYWELTGGNRKEKPKSGRN